MSKERKYCRDCEFFDDGLYNHYLNYGKPEELLRCDKLISKEENHVIEPQSVFAHPFVHNKDNDCDFFEGKKGEKAAAMTKDAGKGTQPCRPGMINDLA